MSLQAISKQSPTNSDRTTPNRRNSAFRYCITVKKSEKFRFLRVTFVLFLCCYCSIFNILIDLSSSSKKNRTLFNINVNTGENRKNSDFRIAHVLSINPKEIYFLLYSISSARARRKKRMSGSEVLSFLRSLRTWCANERSLLI